MGKINKTNKPEKKMSDILTERRKSATNITSGLKRSKSVRASLRLIGNRFLHHHKNQENRENMQKSPSLQSLNENKRDFKRNYFNGEHIKKEYEGNIMLPGVYEKQPVETILKTPRVENSRSHLMMGVNRKNEHHHVKTMGATVLHQLPIEEDRERLCFRGDVVESRHQSWFLHHNRGTGYDLEGRFSELEPGYRAGFHRTSLRLSITSKRRNGMWNSSFSSTSSRFCKMSIV